jgi:hypothetical protein
MRGGSYLYLALAAAAGIAVVFVGSRWALPTVQTLLAYPVLARDLRAGRLGAAARHMVFWAAASCLLTIECAIHFHEAAAAAIFRGEPYREEMFTWIRTGVGAEGSPSLFLPQHFLHYGLVLGVSVVTGGLGGLFLGAILLNYMNYYVGSLILLGSHPVLASAVGWPIWPVIRVVAFVLGAIAAAHLFYARILRASVWKPREAGRLLIWSLILFAADILIKALLAPSWRVLLERALL